MYETHGLDNQGYVFFYEQDFYVLSNFSSFSIQYGVRRFPTAEHLYHYLKFSGIDDESREARREVFAATSAHDAFQTSRLYAHLVRKDWDEVKFDVMRKILRLKVDQHEYVRRKLLATGDRELVENSWRDSVWGWGADCRGQNMLGKLWMELRSSLQEDAPKEGTK